MVRVGIGFDVHKFVKGRSLMLGGVKIPYPLGLGGHSDADVIVHAIIDSLLGAVSVGDIGNHFPDTDQKYRDISSLTLLSRTQEILAGQGYEILNLDVVAILDQPKLASFREVMKERVAKVLRIKPSQLSIKATTTEGLGFMGEKKGIAAFALALVQKP